MKMKHLRMELIATALVLSLCALSSSQELPKAAEGITLHTISTSVPAKCCPNFVFTTELLVGPSVRRTAT